VSTGSPPAAEPHFWVRSAAIWHVVFVLTLGGAIIREALSRDRLHWAALAVLVAIVCWYGATGARAAHRDRCLQGTIYLAGGAPLLLAAVALDGNLTFLLFAAISHIFVFVQRALWACVSVVGLHVAIFTVLLARDPGLRHDFGGLAFALGISLGFSLLFGIWISGIIVQSAQRAGLIDELERTRTALAAERHDAGVLAERTRLAAEIHDTLAQGFTSILMLARAAGATVARDPVAASEQLRLIERTATENLAEARSLVAALAPAALDGATLPEALRRLAARHIEETGVPVEVTVDGDPAVCPDTDVVLLRAAQEALANVRKHASATAVRVGLAYADGVALTVIDDGRGFDPSAAGGGFGLPGLRRRAQDSGGNVTVDSAPGAGTTIRVVLP
jgi:signal transduction histidine kinase